jgi:hypothetical protein
VVADALRDRGAVVGLGPVGDFTDLDWGERGFGHRVGAQKTLPLGEIGLQWVVRCG